MLNLKQLSIPTKNEIDLEIERRIYAASFAEFVKAAWHILEPTTKLEWGWAMDAICDHLQAVSEGKIKRLLINVPPGFSKSLLTSVFWPAWEWGPARMPSMRFVGTSHSKDLAIRDSTKCRTLIESEWFQARWPLELKGDQNAKSNFANKHEGFREAAAFTKMTGKRGDRVILDDPISAFDANSEAELLNVEIAFLETLPSRINNEDSAIVVIMQRLSERDVSGIILDKKMAYTHLMLPMRFEPERKCVTSIGFEDPRIEDGELLFPEFFSETRVATLEQSLGPFGIAGQLQQAPVPRGGGLFNRDWFKPLKAIPNGVVWARGWDLAASTKNTAAYTAGVKIGKAPDGKIIIAHAVRGRFSPEGVRTVIRSTANSDGKSTRVSIPQDPGQAGLAQKSLFSQDLQGFDCRFSTESGDKVTRALPLSAQAEAGNVYYIEGDWNRDFLDEICVFPNGKFKDQTDAASRAYAEVLKMTKVYAGTVSVFSPKIL